MALSIGEKVKILMKRSHITTAELAERLGQSRQNLSNKLSRDNFTEKEIYAIASALGCEAKIEFMLPDGSVI